MLSISFFHKFLAYIFGKSGIFKVKMSSLDTYFCFDLILMGIEYYIFTIYFFPHPWSVHDLCKRGKASFCGLPPHCCLGSNARSCHSASSFNKSQVRGRLPHGETKPSTATLTLEGLFVQNGKVVISSAPQAVNGIIKLSLLPSW